jgi:hypothetical protein
MNWQTSRLHGACPEQVPRHASAATCNQEPIQIQAGPKKPSTSIRTKPFCKLKDDILVELMLPENVNIYTSQYQLYLLSKKELQQILRNWSKEIQSDGE